MEHGFVVSTAEQTCVMVFELTRQVDLKAPQIAMCRDEAKSTCRLGSFHMSHFSRYKGNNFSIYLKASSSKGNLKTYHIHSA